MSDQPLTEDCEGQPGALSALAGAYSSTLAELFHALRGPLASMRTAADLLRGGLVSPADVDALTDLFASETNRTAALLTRCDSFEVLASLKPERRDLRELARARTEARAAEFEARGVSLAYGDGGEALVCALDGAAMNALLDAVLQNALDASAKPARATPLAEGAPPPRVSLSCAREEAHAVLRVSDEGAGLTEGAARNAFRLFYSSRAGEGSAGVGLSLARVVARAHGGAIALAARAPRGVEVTLRLPLAG